MKLNRKQRAFLAAFEETGQITRAAKAAGVDRGAHYDWLQASRDYRRQFDEAAEKAADTLEDEARRRAHEGVLDAVYYQGKPIGARRIYSDGLTMFLLRALRPEKYRERKDVEISGKDGGPIEIKDARLENLSDDELSTLIAISRKLTGPAGDGSGTQTPPAE